MILAHVGNLRAVRGSTALPFGVFLGPSIWLVWCVGRLAAEAGS